MGSFWGITADGWIAIATLLSGVAVLLGILFGAKQVSAQIEAGDVRRYVFDEGVLALKAGIDGLLEFTRLNYALMTRLLKHMESSGGDSLARLRATDIPRVLTDVRPTLNTQAIAPTGELIGSSELGGFMTRAFAHLYAVNTNFEFNVRHRVVNFYEKGLPFDASIQAWVRDISELTYDEYLLADQFYLPISRFLLDAVRVAQKKRLRRFKKLPQVRASKEMKEIARNLDEWSRKTKSQYDEWLRSKSARS